MTLEIRKASAVDTSELSELINRAYRGDESKMGWTTEADLLDGQRTDPESLKLQLSPEGNVMLMFFLKDTRVGCVFLQNRGDRGYLGMLTVEPRAQASGLGKKLMTAAEAWMSANWGVSLVELRVIQQRTELIAWYLRRGYRDTGRREPFPYGDSKAGLPKIKDLGFVVLEKTIAK